MRARYPGKCKQCRKAIEVGQEIDLTYGKAMHMWCGDKLRQRACKLNGDAEQKKEQTRLEIFNKRVEAALAMYERAGFR